MTTFEEMQAAWKAQSARLDQMDLLLADQVRHHNVSRVKAPLRSLIVSLWLELALSAAGMLLIGSFLAGHLTQVRFVWPAAMMDLWFCANLIATIRQLLTATKINYDEPIAGVQQQLGHLRILRLKTFRWLFLSGQIVWWIPFLIISLQAIFGVDAYRYLTSGFIVANMLAGLAGIPLLLVTLKRFRFAAGTSWSQRLGDVIAGQSLAKAQRHAEVVGDFIDNL